MLLEKMFQMFLEKFTSDGYQSFRQVWSNKAGF